MSDMDDTQVLPPPPPAPAEEAPAAEAVSILQGLRAEHTETRQARTKVFVIPGYENAATPLACRYGVIPWADQIALENRTDDSADMLSAFIAQLVIACREMGVMVDGEFKPLSKAKPVRWGSDALVEGLGLEVPERSATAILRAVFDAAQNDPTDVEYAINDHHTDVIVGWMHGGRRRQGAAAEADEEFAKN